MTRVRNEPPPTTHIYRPRAPRTRQEHCRHKNQGAPSPIHVETHPRPHVQATIYETNQELIKHEPDNHAVSGPEPPAEGSPGVAWGKGFPGSSFALYPRVLYRCFGTPSWPEPSRGYCWGNTLGAPPCVGLGRRSDPHRPDAPLVSEEG